jgi:hypothetical protein
VAVCNVTETEPVKLPPLGLTVGVAAVGKLTVRLNAVDRVTPPPVADTVTANVPAGVEPLVFIANVEEQVALQLAGEKAAVAPTGSPEAEKVTV